jgi:hypothetical protein
MALRTPSQLLISPFGSIGSMSGQMRKIEGFTFSSLNGSSAPVIGTNISDFEELSILLKL